MHKRKDKTCRPRQCRKMGYTPREHLAWLDVRIICSPSSLALTRLFIRLKVLGRESVMPDLPSDFQDSEEVMELFDFSYFKRDDTIY